MTKTLNTRTYLTNVALDAELQNAVRPELQGCVPPMLHNPVRPEPVEGSNLPKFTPKSAQRGAALVTAMLLAALIATLAATWLTRFDTHLRLAEVQRTGTQARWLLRSAMDWARVIVSEDRNAYDALSEVWAVPIAPTRITDVAGAQAATFSGQLTDAQALFNLNSLRKDMPDAAQKARLIDWARTLAQGAGLTKPQSDAWIIQAASITDAQAAVLAIEDIMPSGASEATVQALAAVFIWLPQATAVNINTVGNTVLAADPKLGARADTLIARRNQSPIASTAQIGSALGIQPADAAGLDVKTDFFLATGRLSIGRIDVMARSLMQRQAGGAPKLLWTIPL